MAQTIIFEYSAWLLFACFALAFAYSFGLYFRDKKLAELSKNKIRILAILRFLSSLVISLLLLAPLFRTSKTDVEKPIIIFANDNSESIKLSYSNNEDLLLKIQNSIENSYTNISEKFESRQFSFGNKMSEGLLFDYTEPKTNLSGVFEEVNNKFYNKNIGALVLISDGIYTKGMNPVYSSSQISYPVYCVGMGDTTSYKDLKIKAILHNEIAFVNNKFPLEVTIVANKLHGKSVSCKVTNRGKVIYSENFDIQENNFLKKIKIFIQAKNTGIEHYKVSLTELTEEQNIINNHQNFSINILDNKQKILILANSPHPDISALRNALKSNQNFDVKVDFISNMTGEITDYSLVILHQLPSVNNSISDVYTKLRKNKIPILFVLGTQSKLALFNNLNIGLNILQKNNIFDKVQGVVNNNFSEFELSKNLHKLVESAPPLIVPYGDIKLTLQSQSVLFRRVKNINTQNPLIVVSGATVNYEANTGFITGEGLWRWRLFEFGKNNSFEEFDNLINQIVQFLVIPRSKNKFIVKVNKIISVDEEVIFKSEVYNKIYELTNDNDISLQITDSVGKTYDYIMQRNGKSYFLNIGNLPVGNYSYSAKTKLGDKNLKTSGQFAVTYLNVEAQDLVANHTLMYKIAEQTGGKFIYPDNIDSLGNFLQVNNNIVSVSHTTQDLTQFIRYKWIFFFVIAMLSIEWFLRKFFGTY